MVEAEKILTMFESFSAEKHYQLEQTSIQPKGKKKKKRAQIKQSRKLEVLYDFLELLQTKYFEKV